ncbi:MAG: alpha/beta hydrolase [Bdellovibrionota bacterium]
MNVINQLRRIVSVFAILVQTACVSLGGADYIVEKEIVFKVIEGESLKGDLYLPKKSGLKPAVMVVHGGGWNKRSGDMESICEDLAEAGFVVFNTTYRLAPAHHFPKAVDDTRDALTWLKTNAEKYSIDKNRIAGWGYSAGANLILLVGLDPAQGLKAIVAGGTPADLTVWPDSPLVNGFIGHSLKESPDLWNQASPVNHVKKESPAVFLYHGEWDKLVEPEQMKKMTDALKKENVVTESYLAPLQGHVVTYFLSQKSVDLGIDFISRQLKQ